MWDLSPFEIKNPHSDSSGRHERGVTPSFDQASVSTRADRAVSPCGWVLITTSAKEFVWVMSLSKVA